MGGALASVVEGVTGVFFDEQTPEALAAAVRRFRDEQFDPLVIRRHAEQFDTERFLERFERFVEDRIAEHPPLARRGGSAFTRTSDQRETPVTSSSVVADQSASQ